MGPTCHAWLCPGRALIGAPVSSLLPSSCRVLQRQLWPEVCVGVFLEALFCMVLQVEESEDEDEGPGGDDDLYAFKSIADTPSQASSSKQQGHDQEGNATMGPPRSRQPGGFGGPTVFASMTLGMNDAMLQINRAFRQMTVRAQNRRSLVRPS